MYWKILSQEYPVVNGHSSCAIHMNNILVILTNFDNNTGLVPFGWVVASLVLYAHMITDLKRGSS